MSSTPKITTTTGLEKWIPEPRQQANCGDNLYARAEKKGKVLRYRHGKEGWSTLGVFKSELSWADAKAMCAAITEARKLGANKNKIDMAIAECDHTPERLRRLLRDDRPVEEIEVPTFGELYLEWYQRELASNRWTGKASIDRPMSCFRVHLQPAFGDIPINKLRPAYLADQIEAMYASAPSRSKDLHGYTDEVFEYALRKEYILANPLPKKKSLTIPKTKPKSHGFVDWREAPKLWRWIETQDFSALMKLALKLQLVTVHRSSVIACMRWEHLELDQGVFTVPERPIGGDTEGYMKSSEEFSIQLPKALVEELRQHQNGQTEGYVFKGRINNPHMASGSLLVSFKKYDRSTTAHGCRSTFHGWADNLQIDERFIDKYCDHAVTGTKKSYRRDDFFEKRYEVAEQYYAYLSGKS